MATVTTKTPPARETLRPVDEHPGVRETAGTLEAAAQQAHALSERVARYEALSDPHKGRSEVTATAEEWLEARSELPDLRVARDRALLAFRRADAAHAMARSRARAELRAAFEARQRPLVRKLGEALDAAAAANRALAALEATAAGMVGSPIAEYAWFELGDETALAPTRLSDWNRAVRAGGVLT